MTVMRAAYERQAMQPGIRKLFASTPVMATWDDHDYGRNDAGVEYPKKREAQREFLRFFGVPQDSPMWRRDGVYSSSILGPPGKRVQVIMLDTRYFRSPMQRWSKGAGPTPGSAGGPYKPSDDENATVLGEAQWLWLEDQLRQEADVRIIATSIQAVAGEHGYEAWINFPVERTRLFEVIRETEAKGVVLLSGDRHLAEISVLPPDDPDGVGYPLYDVTSSSLNRPSTATTLEPNKYRVYETNYRSVNYGTIVFDWSSDPTMRMQIRNIDGTVVVESVVRLSDLQPGSN
jgi:alkaline phosphatase D